MLGGLLLCVAGTATAFWLAVSVRGRRRERLLWLTGFALLAGPAWASFAMLEPQRVDGACHRKPIDDLLLDVDPYCHAEAVEQAWRAGVGGGVALLVAGGAAVGAWRASG